VTYTMHPMSIGRGFRMVRVRRSYRRQADCDGAEFMTMEDARQRCTGESCSPNGTGNFSPGERGDEQVSGDGKPYAGFADATLFCCGRKMGCQHPLLTRWILPSGGWNVGAQLFNGPRASGPDDYGQEFYERVSGSISDLEDAEKQVRDAAETPRGTNPMRM